MAQAACFAKSPAAFSTHGVTSPIVTGIAALHAAGAQKAKVEVLEEEAGVEEEEGETMYPKTGTGRTRTRARNRKGRRVH